MSAFWKRYSPQLGLPNSLYNPHILLNLHVFGCMYILLLWSHRHLRVSRLSHCDTL